MDNRLMLAKATDSVDVRRATSVFKRPFLIGGGALRDGALGARPKDVDVFVGADFTPADVRPDYRVRKEGEDPAFPNEYTEFFRDSFVGIYSAFMPSTSIFDEGPPIQIIVLRELPEMETLARGFDFGANQVVLSCYGAAFATDAWFKDIRDRTLTYALSHDVEPTRWGRAWVRGVRLEESTGLRLDLFSLPDAPPDYPTYGRRVSDAAHFEMSRRDGRAVACS